MCLEGVWGCIAWRKQPSRAAAAPSVHGLHVSNRRVHAPHLYWQPLSTFSFSRRRSDSRHSYTAPSAPADTTRVSLLAQQMARTWGWQRRHVGDQRTSTHVCALSCARCRACADKQHSHARIHTHALAAARTLLLCPRRLPRHSAV